MTTHGPGGVVADTLCPKHGCPRVSLITEETLCPACERAARREAEGKAREGITVDAEWLFPWLRAKE
jgi:uncharacterized Zn finger protein (UPF0148 family)